MCDPITIKLEYENLELIVTYCTSDHLIDVLEDLKLGRKGLQSREYIEENTMPSQHTCYGTVSYSVGSAGPILAST
jgi:hypothetical protein